MQSQAKLVTIQPSLTEFRHSNIICIQQVRLNIFSMTFCITWLHLILIAHEVANNTHTHPFDGPFSGSTQVSQYQKGKPIWILRKQESGSGISWVICKSASRFRQIAVPASHHSVFYRLDALSATQPTASKRWRPKKSLISWQHLTVMHLTNVLQSLVHLQLIITVTWHEMRNLHCRMLSLFS